MFGLYLHPEDVEDVPPKSGFFPNYTALNPEDPEYSRKLTTACRHTSESLF
jgi:hypothetical protein